MCEIESQWPERVVPDILGEPLLLIQGGEDNQPHEEMTMYKLLLRKGKAIKSEEIQQALNEVEAECGTTTHQSRMAHLSRIEQLEARGMQYSNQDFDVLSSALNFLDAVHPDHKLREEASPVGS